MKNLNLIYSSFTKSKKTITKILLPLTFFSLFILNETQGQINGIFFYGNDKTPPWGKGLVDFTSGTPLNIINNNRRLGFLQCNAAICDSSGSLLYVSNGFYIVDKNDSIMPGGDSINLSSGAYNPNTVIYGSSLSQGLLSIPNPGHPNEYLMFQVQFKDDPNVYWINVIDYHHISMDSAGGLGKVISHNNLVLNDSMTESFFSAVKHGNGRDWWLVKLQRNTNSYFKFLVTPTGITMSTQALGPIGESATYEGQSAFSQDGRYYARADSRLDTVTFMSDTGQVVIMEFDRCTGTFSKLIVDLIDSAYVGGVAFSPNGKFLYVATLLHIYQYNLQDGSNMVNTKKIIATYDGYSSPFANSWATFWQMFVGADKKIYCITQSQSDNMTVINQPDLFDTLCDAQPHSFHFGILNNRTCPNWPNYELGPELGSICDSLGLAQYEVITSVGLHLFPNPANGFYNIRYSIPGNATAIATVYDIHGKKIEQHNLYGQFSNLQVSTAMYTPGLYVVNVSCNNVSESKRVLVVE